MNDISKMSMMDVIKKILSAFLCILLIFVAGCGAGYYVCYARSKPTPIEVEDKNDDFDLKLPGEVEKYIITVDEVKAKIFEIGELATCEGDYTLTKGKDFTRYILDDKKIPGTTNHIEITCKGVVKAGYVLDDILVKVDELSKTIYVTLPEPKILSNQLLWDENMTYNEKNNILNPIDHEQYQTLIEEIMHEGLGRVEEDGLYDTVETNAKVLIRNFLGCFVDYKVSFMSDD